MRHEELLQLVDQRLAELGISAAAASTRAVGNHYLIRNMHRRTGGMPSVESLRALCDVLGLEFYIGPHRDAGDLRSETGGREDNDLSTALPDLEISAQTLNRVVTDAGGDPIPEDLWPVLLDRRGLVVASGLADLDALAAAAANDIDDVPGARPVDVVELDAAAGGGLEAAVERVAGRVWFRRDWLDRHGLDPTRCAVMGVKGESMEPLLHDGASILVDRARADWREGHYYVVLTDEGLVAKRAGVADDGDWLLVSEHPSYPPVPLPEDAEIVGEVIWTALTLRTEDVRSG